MMVMAGNHLSSMTHYLAGKYPGRIGILNTPQSWKNPPFYIPYALDNGCFIRWQPDKFQAMLMKCRKLHKPLWVVVPDVIGNAGATLELWHEWKDKIASFGYALAFACQDGMEPEDVPKGAICCFIGGTTYWKLKNAHKFKGITKLLHIGRVSTLSRLKWAKLIGADSVDGTGFFRGGKENPNNKQLWNLIDFLSGKQQQLNVRLPRM